MEKPGPHYNTKALVGALERLIAKLPDPFSPAPSRPERPRVRTARQLGAEQTEQLIAGYRVGATVFELSERFGIDRRTVGVLLKRSGVPTGRPRPRQSDEQEVVETRMVEDHRLPVGKAVSQASALALYPGPPNSGAAIIEPPPTRIADL